MIKIWSKVRGEKRGDRMTLGKGEIGKRRRERAWKREKN